MRVLAAVCVGLLLALVPLAAAAGCHSTVPSYGVQNKLPLLNGSNAATLVSSLAKDGMSGKLYNVSVPNWGGNTTSSFLLLHLWGDSAYDMGYVQGTLLKNEMPFISEVWSYLEEQIDQVINFLPVWLANWIADVGLDAALDLTYDATVEYTGAYFYEELHGIADAAGIDYTELRNIHMIAGLTQGKCSMAGIWGEALSASGNSQLLQFRALDWNMDGPFVNFAQVTVYHPPAGANWSNFAIVGFPGFIGGLTGMNDKQLGISEIGVDYPDATFGTESRFGVPFIFLLRDILQWDVTFDDAANRMINAARTCDLILGVGDGKLNEFRSFAYSSSRLVMMDDLNMLPNNSTWHPRITDIVYHGMDWICPSYNLVLSQQLQKYYGQITSDTVWSNITSVEMSGDNHLAVYDLSNLLMDVAFAAPHWVGGPAEAYNRQFTRLNMAQIFAEAPPTQSFGRVVAGN